MQNPAPKTEGEWKKKLTAEQYHILREGGTEPAFTGKYFDSHKEGVYKCAACGNELFSSDTKFDSGTGWPSFANPMNLENVELRTDTSHGMTRTEVVCKKCGSHLGHVFDDGPSDKGGKRYCINSVCLELEEKKENELPPRKRGGIYNGNPSTRLRVIFILPFILAASGEVFW